MKKYYCSPIAEKILFRTEEILGASGDNPILDNSEENTPQKPAEEFGDIDIF